MFSCEECIDDHSILSTSVSIWLHLFLQWFTEDGLIQQQRQHFANIEVVPQEAVVHLKHTKSFDQLLMSWKSCKVWMQKEVIFIQQPNLHNNSWSSKITDCTIVSRKRIPVGDPLQHCSTIMKSGCTYLQQCTLLWTMCQLDLQQLSCCSSYGKKIIDMFNVSLGTSLTVNVKYPKTTWASQSHILAVTTCTITLLWGVMECTYGICDYNEDGIWSMKCGVLVPMYTGKIDETYKSPHDELLPVCISIHRSKEREDRGTTIISPRGMSYKERYMHAVCIRHAD